MACQGDMSSWNSVSESALVQNFPLHCACRDGNVNLLMQLLQQNSSSHIYLEDTYYGWTPLHWAAYFGKVECVGALARAWLCSNNASLNIATTRFQQTPVHIAAFAGRPNCLHLLLDGGANPNSRDYLGETALHKACRTGSEECAALLVAAKVAIHPPNDDHCTPADLAVRGGHAALAEKLNTIAKPETQFSNGAFISSSGYYGFQPRLNGDITLDAAVVANRVPLAGRKRSREECGGMVEEVPSQERERTLLRAKRAKTENNAGETPNYLSWPTTDLVREHACAVAAERSYNAAQDWHNNMADVHGC